MKKVNKKYISNLLRGSSILACGGGLSYAEQKSFISKVGVEEFDLISPSEIEDESNAIVVAELGPADAAPLDHTKIPSLLSYYKRKTKNAVSYILPGEIGQESITIAASLSLGLPIVDSDLAGGRAVPSLSSILLATTEPSFTMSPLAIMTSDGKFDFVSKQSSLYEDESRLREIVARFPGQVLVFMGGILSGSMVKQRLANHTYSLAMSVGESVADGDLNSEHLDVLFGPEHVVIASVILKRKDGFVDKKILLEGETTSFKLMVENEYMSIAGGGYKYSFPDLITLVDPKSFVGISSGDIKKGMPAVLTIYNRHSFWYESD